MRKTRNEGLDYYLVLIPHNQELKKIHDQNQAWLIQNMKKATRKEDVTNFFPLTKCMHILIGTTRGELLNLADGDKGNVSRW